ncbi:Uncharacterised protein [Vibrio cholerae]|nr:Uncharacterised protein [Vibrio cholerae]CSD12953.1 Uncharacterised protein [Vibrio cholerae]
MQLLAIAWPIQLLPIILHFGQIISLLRLLVAAVHVQSPLITCPQYKNS